MNELNISQAQRVSGGNGFSILCLSSLASVYLGLKLATDPYHPETVGCTNLVSKSIITLGLASHYVVTGLLITVPVNYVMIQAVCDLGYIEW